MNAELDEVDQLAEGRMQRKALLFIWFVIGVVGLSIFLYGQYQLNRARGSVTWPLVDGKIITSQVQSHRGEDGTTYSADIEYSYTVNEKQFKSDVIVIGGHDYGSSAVERYPLGESVTVAYNPVKPHQAVLEPGVESTELQTWGISMMSGSFFMAVLFNFILRRAMNEDKNAGDHVLILLFKTLFFPFVIADGNPLIMGAMVGVAYWITTLEFHPVLTVSAQVFTALYGLGLIFMLWGCLLGWLMSLSEADDGS
jgi:hypothetical protein